MPRNIVSKPDREAMEAIFGKRVMRLVDEIRPPVTSESGEDFVSMEGA